MFSSIAAFAEFARGSLALVEALRLDLVGPWAGHRLAEERLRGRDRPSNWYLTGFLIPPGFPTGIRAEMLSQEHRSIPRNPLIAGAFHRTGAIERSGRTNRTKFRDQVLAPLIEAGLVERTIPDKPRSPKQQYRTTEAGRQRLRGEP